MAAERHSWNDGRLDDLQGRVGNLQQEMRAGFARVDTDLHAIGGRIDGVNERIDGVNERIDGLQRTLLQIGGAMIVSQAGLILSLLLTKL